MDQNKSKRNQSVEHDFKAIKMIHPNAKKVKFDALPVIAFSKVVSDPRLDTVKTEKATSRSQTRFPKSLHEVKWKYDKHSIGNKPTVEVVIWNLHSTTTSIILRNNFSKYGEIGNVMLVEDPETAMPLGMASLSFNGDLDAAHESAVKASIESNRKLTIQGRVIRCGINTDNKLYEEIYRKTMDARTQRLLKLKEEKLEQERNALRARKAKEKNELLKLKSNNRNLQSGKALVHSSQVIPSNLSLSAHDRHILPYSTSILPDRFEEQIKNNPYILISSQYIPPKYVNYSVMRDWLGHSRYSQILSHNTGFFVVFSNWKDAQICFDNLDGQRVYTPYGSDYKLYMTLYLPNHLMRYSRIGHLIETIFPSIYGKSDLKSLAKGPSSLKERNIVPKKKEIPLNAETSACIIQKELGEYLMKDISDFTLTNMIKSVLESQDVQEKRNQWAEQKKREAEERIHRAELEKKENGGGHKTENTAAIVKTLDVNLLIGKKKESFIKKEPKKKGLSKAKGNKLAKDGEQNKMKRRHSFDNNDQNIAEESKGYKEEIQEEDSRASVTDTEELETPTTTAEPEITENEDVKEQTVEEPTDFEEQAEKKIDIYEPTFDFPQPIYNDDQLFASNPTLTWVKSCIKSDEDVSILKKIFESKAIAPAIIKNLDFWGWSHMEAHRIYQGLISLNQAEEVDEGDKFDFEEEIQANLSLKNVTGCFRTEPYKKIPDSEKHNYLIHRRKLTQLNPVSEDHDDDNNNSTSHTVVQSSRVNRANDRRFAADINMIGGANLELNKLNKRKKPVQFARSAIHNWGLYALEPISSGEMIIEYVGERIRQQIAELREKKYLRSGIGSSYLFRVDENTVIDASKKGGIARFINHCCEPSCTAKIIKVDGSKRIVIYALRDIKKNEELTYDYKFERETNDAERITCLCGAKGCKGFLN